MDAAIQAETEANTRATAALTAANKARTEDADAEGVIISMRDPDSADNKAASNWAWKEKPSIHLNKTKVTITTMTGKPDDPKQARITLDKNGVSIEVGDQKAGVKERKGSVQLSNGKKKAMLESNGSFVSTADKIDFSKATKVTLG